MLNMWTDIFLYCMIYWCEVHLRWYTYILCTCMCKLIWRHWNHKMPVRYILSSVWVRLIIFSHLSIIQYMGLCVFSLSISLVVVERIYTLSYYHHQIGSMNYYPLFWVRSWNNGVGCMSLYIRMYDICSTKIGPPYVGYISVYIHTYCTYIYIIYVLRK